MTNEERIDCIVSGIMGAPDVKAVFEALAAEVKSELAVLEIIRRRKLLNYVLKNKKCADMYHLTDEETDALRKWAGKGMPDV